MRNDIEIRRSGAMCIDICIHADEKHQSTVQELKDALDLLLFKEENFEWLAGVWMWHDNARSFSGLKQNADQIIKLWVAMAKKKSFEITL